MLDRFENVKLPSSPEDLANRPEFVEALKDEQFWQRIPLMNAMAVADLSNMQIVRFRGMLQDMAEPEIYATRYEVRNRKTGSTRHENGKYRDYHGMQRDEFVVATDRPELGMRRNFYVLTVPGLNAWATQHERETNRNNNNNFIKAPTTDPASMETEQTNEEATEAKRARLSDDPATQPAEAMDEENDLAVVCFDAEEATEAERTGPKYPGRDAFNSPIRSRPSRGCTVVVYDDYDSFPLNSLVDVVGFVWLDESAGGGEQIPRLHAIRMRTLDRYNPLLDMGGKDTPNMAATQRDLMTLLRLCVFDDELAAQYLLMHLISRVYVRTEVAAIGKFSVNLWRIPSEALDYYPSELYQVLELLVPASHYLPLTLDNLRSIPFRASKDYDANCLLSGLLQLAPHTHLVLDETLLAEGTMQSTEINNLSDLALLLDSQQSRAQFGTYTKDFAADIPVLMLSQGRSILQNQVDVDLPLQPDPQRVNIGLESFKAARHFLSAERLDAMRRYLTVAKMAAVEVSEAMGDHMSEDYVKMRAASGGATAAAGPCDSQDLHHLMMMSRMLAISEGKTHVDHDTWNASKSLLAEIKKRQSAYPKTSAKFHIK